MKPSPRQGQGEILKLGPPCPGEITLTVDSQKTGSPFSSGLQTLLPGSEIPLHRHLRQDEVVFVHKGQGRAVLEQRSMTVVPGIVLYAPRGAWHGLRNTGTGMLQITWTVAPPGIEAFFRELSRLGRAADPKAIQELGQRHGIEFSSSGQPTKTAAVASTPRHGRRRRRGGRRRGRGSPPPAPQGQPVPLGTPHPAPEPAPAPSKATPEGRGESAPERPGPRSSPAAPRPRHHGAPVKEVYMGGRWIRVVGEGPVIAPGPERPPHRRKK